MAQASGILVSHENIDTHSPKLSSSEDERNKLTELWRVLPNPVETGPHSNSKCFTDCSEKSHLTFINLLESTLQCTDDRYVVYTTQKVLVTFLKQTPCQAGLQLVKTMIGDGKISTNILTGLQICRQLFSNQCSHRYHVFCKLTSSLVNAWKFITVNIKDVCSTQGLTADTNHVGPIQGLYDLLSVLSKVVKMYASQPEGEQMLLYQQFLKQILSPDIFCDILFSGSIKHYIKSKCIHFLCTFLNMTLKRDEVFRHDSTGISMCLAVFEGLCSRDLRQSYIIDGTQTFVGIQCMDSSDSSYEAEGCNINMAHIREWTHLVFTVSACLRQQQEYVTKVTGYLSEVDTLLQQHLNVSSSLLFPWLPEVYNDEDDVWIDVMLLILDIYTHDDVTHVSDKSSYIWQHHQHFLQFIRTLGYDHLVLIDLLTSPETNCLTYFTKYLKLLQVSWSEFVHVTELLNNVDKDVESSDDASIDDNPAFCVSDSMCKMVLENNSDIKCTSFSDNTLATKSDLECVYNASDSNVSPAQYCDHGGITNGHTTVSKGAGLTLLAGAYNDDDSDDENSNTDNLSDAKNDNVNSFTDNYAAADTVADSADCTSDDLEVHSDDSLESHSDEGSSDNYEATKYNNVLKELNDNHSCYVKKESFLLDASMGMLIRTRMKLERLRDSDLISYNPNVLIHIMTLIEEFYEETEVTD